MRDRAGGCLITPRVVLGFALIAMGVVFTLENLGVDDVWNVFWLYGWPAMFMVAGLSKLLWPAGGSGRGIGLVLFAVGLIMLLGSDRLGVLRFELKDLIPVVFVLIGASFLWRGLFGRHRPTSEPDAKTINAVAVLGGSRRTTGTGDFHGGDLVAFMGGVEIDLTQAEIQDRPAVIDAFAMWGGVEIKVPKTWQVTLQGIPLLGGFVDSTTPPGEPRGRLIVKGFAIMGGVEVKNG